MELEVNSALIFLFCWKTISFSKTSNIYEAQKSPWKCLEDKASLGDRRRIQALCINISGGFSAPLMC